MNDDEDKQAVCCLKGYVQKCPMLNLLKNWSTCCSKPEWIHGAERTESLPSSGLLVILHSSGRRADALSCADVLSRTNFTSMTFVKGPRSTVAMVVLLIFYTAQGLVALGYD